jgi:hypothetical protein
MRKTLRFILSALILAAVGAPAFAQVATTPYTAPEYYATSFGLWSINAQSPNTFIFQGRNLCNSAGQNVQFFDFSTTGPVLIADANTANSEVKTPSAIVNTAGSCGVTLAPSNQHYNFQLRSGTAGLQEAINALKGGGGQPAVVVLDRNWFAQANSIPGTAAATILAAATGDGTVILKDITAQPAIYYVVGTGGSTYSVGNWVNTAPTLTNSTGAGSSPTTSNSAGSTALSGVVSILTGTTPATTATIFVETWPTSNSLLFAGTCTVASSGANVATFTKATSYSGGRVLTVTSTSTALIAATQYYFTYNCK